MKKESLTKEIEWFCTQAVAEKLLTPDDCVAVINAIEENNIPVTLDIFVSVVKDNSLASDPGRLDAVVNKARDMAKFFPGPPKNSIFSNASAAPTPVQAAPAKAAAPASAPAPAPKPTTINAQSAGWLTGWPRLEEAASLDKEGAIRLLNDFLHKAREAGCSDVHISTGAVPFVRRYKTMHLLTDQGVLSAQAAEKLNLAPLQGALLERFTKHNDLDYGYNITTTDRYRTNVMRQRLGLAGSYRIIDNHVRKISELGFPNPEVIEKLTTYNQGLILVAGPAGSGKTTTLAAMVDHVNRTRSDHVITVEDPIEVVFNPVKCNLTQRELNSHTKSFGNALRAALREDPDIIVIGEMRDLETVEMAIHSSETGHLVIGTLHTSSAAETMNRILDVFPHNQQAQIRAMVAESLKGVICQQLLPNKDGNGVILAPEILLGTLAVSNLIREGKTYQLESTIQTSKHLGMISMEQSHFGLYMAGKRGYEETLPYIKNRDLLRQMQANEASHLARQNGLPPPEEQQKKRRWF
ncbi:MAG: PilT/PilU family type 4a pilus ATPase [Victivallales bacterium]|nr:PilT/PilU family type 4a pilus ATPase [Victivallales bacterium]